MRRLLAERAVRPELMDDASAGGPELSAALRQLRVLNRIFHASGPTVYGVERLWRAAGRPRSLRMLDVGCGSGDVNRALLRWADKHGVDMAIRLIDQSAEACAEAEAMHRNEPRIAVAREDLFESPAGEEIGPAVEEDERADIVTATQLLHHFEGERLTAALQAMLRRARLGVVINDIHRHWLAWLAVWGVSRLLPGNRYIRHDGPLSVAKGFRSADWQALAGSLPGQRLTYRWRPLFRYAATVTPLGRGGGPDG